MDLQGKRAIVTGATAGIGLATARALRALGMELLLIGRRVDRLETIREELGAMVLALDVCDAEAWVRFLQDNPEWQQPAVLVNNAGLAKGTDPLQTGRREDWEQMMRINVEGLLAISQPILKAMVEAGEGHIVNLGSVAGRWTYPGGAVYCASKHAVRAISEGMRLDTLGSGLRVSNIEPGLVETEFSIVRFHGDKEKADSVYADTTPLQPEDVADAIAYCVTRPAHVNVQEMVLYPTDQASVRDVHRV